MKLACPVLRDGGSKVELWGTEYFFAPQPDGEHVAEVADPKHQDRLLECGYRIYRPGAKQKPAEAPPAPPAKPDLLGSNVHPAEIDVGGKTVTLGEVVAVAFARSGMETAQWNELPEETRHELIDAELDFMAGDADGDGQTSDDEKTERDALVEQYVAKYGKKPHHKLGNDKIREALAAQ